MNTQMKNTIKTICEMMNDRGYTDFSRELSQRDTYTIIKDACINNGITYIDGESQDGKKIRIVFIIQVKWKSTDLKKLLDEDLHYALLVCREKPTVNNIKIMKETFSNLDFQIFTFKELQINITKHELVPKHELLGFNREADVQKILQVYNIKSRNSLPLILRSDPVARYFNAKPGNLMRITRPSPTSGEYIFYRCCV